MKKDYILVADDELTEPIANELAELGYPVKECHDGKEALETIESSAGKCVLLVTDNQMPRMTGKDLILAVFERQLPVDNIFLVSGLISEQIGIKGIKEANTQQVPFRFFEKPPDYDRIRQALKDLGFEP